ncbi:MAG TPA: PKD domain-containing protein [bacterium]|jgi:predicted outer membrane repeat protein
MRSNRVLLLLSYLLTLSLLGCSGADTSIAPSLDSDNSGIDTQSAAGLEPGRNLWSYHQIYIDPATLEYEMLPVRLTQAHYNVVGILESSDCADCLQLKSLQISPNATLLVTVQLTNPMPPPKFVGFDVRGIAMFDGNNIFPVSGFSAPNRQFGDGELVNADGFTPHYSPSSGGSDLQGYITGKMAIGTPSASMNGYKLFVSDVPGNSRHYLYGGDTVEVTYDIALPSGPFVMGYAVDSSWAPPTVDPVVDPQTDFPPEANAREAWKIAVTENPVGDGLTELGGSEVLSVDVYSYTDQTFQVRVESFDLFDGEVSTDVPVSSGDGFATYELTVQNSKLVEPGEYYALLTAEYQLAGSKSDGPGGGDDDDDDEMDDDDDDNSGPGGDDDDDVDEDNDDDDDNSGPGGDDDDDDDNDDDDNEGDDDDDEDDDDNNGGGGNSPQIFAAYQVIRLVVSDSAVEKVPPVAMATAAPLEQAVNQNISFSDNGSFDPDGGAIAKYEWDFENDGTWDAVGPNVSHSYSSVGVYNVQFRVTDNEGEVAVLAAPIQVTIIDAPLQNPVAIASADPTTQDVGVAVHFFDNGSNDPDGGNIVTYEWDWDNNGVYDQQGADVNHVFNAAGTYNVQFRVTDDEGAIDTLDSPLVITINDITPQITWDNMMGGVFASQCTPCHITSSSGGKNYSTYQNFINSNVAIPGDPDNSKVYNTIKNGNHFGQMTSEQLGWLYQWILDGLPEN